MSLDDVWRDVSKYISVYTSRNFDAVPSAPGVYAWFYPIELPSRDVKDLAIELSSILNYDSKIQDTFSSEAYVDFNWKRTKVSVSEESNASLSSTSKQEWDRIVSNGEDLQDFRKILLASSILMPPLYIGKTNNLLRRCIEHRKGTDNKNEFHSRFESFTQNKELENGKNFLSQNVDDLIFVCIRTDLINNRTNYESNVEELLENILQLIAKPPYSRK